MEKRDYYEILGVSRDANEKEIKSAHVEENTDEFFQTLDI